MYLHSLDGEADGSEKVLYGDNKEAMRKAAMAHSLNHVLKYVAILDLIRLQADNQDTSKDHSK
jgi:hypothetical protein